MKQGGAENTRRTKALVARSWPREGQKTPLLIPAKHIHRGKARARKQVTLVQYRTRNFILGKECWILPTYAIIVMFTFAELLC